MERWLISDTHFGHEKIILYESRPFSTIQEMDRTIIKNWNESINKKDKVFLLGDFCFRYGREKVEKLVKRLKGYKILIIGNHDYDRSNAWWSEVGFNEVSRYPIIVDEFYIFSHYPLYINKNMPYVNVHGHLHSKNMDDNQHINVGVEQTNYKPINFEDIKKRYKIETED
jgi:calcineurin-like phosphoesterase family protein